MYITTYNRFPSLAFSNIFDDIDRHFFGLGSGAMTNICTNVFDKGDFYLLESELPGFEKSDISIQINGDILLVSAKSDCNNESSQDNLIKRERRYGSYSRSFDVSEIDKENIEAEYKNGLLLITLPKLKKQEPESRQIEIK